VSLTRAKYGLFVIGNATCLSTNPRWNDLILFFQRKGVLVDGPLHSPRVANPYLHPKPNPASPKKKTNSGPVESGPDMVASIDSMSPEENPDDDDDYFNND
jgi:hypothetical protein